jgi:hypothetical protein
MIFRPLGSAPQQPRQILVAGKRFAQMSPRSASSVFLAMAVALAWAIGCESDDDDDGAACIFPEIDSNGMCVCAPSYIRAGDSCIQCDYPEIASGDQCICDDGYIRAGEQCLEIQRVACCECLAQELEFDGSAYCINLSTVVCSESTFSAQCHCWEACYSECDGVGYPYDEPPNSCNH